MFLFASLTLACGDSSGTSDSSTAGGTAPGTSESTTAATGTSGTSTAATTNQGGSESESVGTTAQTSTGQGTTSVGSTTTGASETTASSVGETSTSATTSGTSATTGSTTTGVETETETDTGLEEPCGCADIEVPLDDGIFVLSDDGELWKYRPDQDDFENLGAIGCGMPNTFSMGVDRLGYAWVMFNPPAGELRKVDVTNPADCSDPGYNPGQLGVELYGMAFVSNSQVDQCDNLYGNTYNGIGGFGEGPGAGDFLTVDPETLQLSLLGDTTFNGAELTGTGDGRAFMFGGVNPAKLIEVDKSDGTYVDVLPLGDLDLTNAFAFAFFAGDFYFFTESGLPGSNSKVTHLDYDDSDNNGVQDLTTVNAEGPIRIVGAGVSTCAPFQPM